MKKVKTLQLGKKLIILNGVDPIMYVDLNMKKLHIFKEKSNVQKPIEVIQDALESGNFDWTSKNSLVIYTPLHEDFRYINVNFKVTE